MKRAPEAAGRFFPWHSMEKDKVAELGYFPICVSIFDHYLTQEEYDACHFMFYREAVEKGKLDEYTLGERQFLALYRDLAKEGAYVQKRENYWLAKADDAAFIRLQVESLRELNSDTRMDVYFIGPQIRVHGCHDRTDMFFLSNNDYLPKLKEKVRAHGLYTLVAKRFQ
jgi:hypothetical protein